MKFSDISDLSSITKLTLSVNRDGSCGAYNLTIYAKQNDKSSRYLEVEVKSGGRILSIPVTAIARIRCTKPDGTSVFNDGCVHNGKIYVELSAQILAAPGVVKADIGIYNGEAVLSTASFDIEVVETPFDEDAVTSADEFSALTEALNTVGSIYAFEAELADIRTDVNDKVHSSAGEAVRTQINAVSSLIYNGRTEDGTKPTVMLKYSGEMTSIADMPADSWLIMNGQEINDLLGGSFPWTLGANRTYKITRRNWTNISVIVFEIESITGLERYIGYTSSGDISALRWNNLTPEAVASDVLAAYSELPERRDEILYTEIEKTKGWWSEDGSYLDTSRYHSQLMPVVGSKAYYLGFRFDPETASSDVTVSGAFFDANGKWIAPLLTADITAYDYRSADGNAVKSSKYADIYTFTAPQGACYFSLNLSSAVANTYRQCVASSPVLALAGSGNYGFDSNYAPYQAHKDKKLCVIGASGVAYNRSLQTVNGAPRYIVGFQEYLAPWYALVESYGFAGGGYRKNDASKYPSIYKGIIEGGVVGNVDLSGYDEFLFIPSTNDLTLSNMGEIDSTDTATYFGGLNAIISRIYAESPNAKIYLANAMHKGSYYTNSGTKEKIDTLNAKLAALADYDSLQLIDLAGGSGVNRFNYAEGNMTFDGTHLNQEGNKRMGLYLRKEMVGI